jgi:hypothetical protein
MPRKILIETIKEIRKEVLSGKSNDIVVKEMKISQNKQNIIHIDIFLPYFIILYNIFEKYFIYCSDII